MQRSPKISAFAHEYGSKMKFMQKFAISAKIVANDERSYQFKTLKQMFLSKHSPHRMAYGCILESTRGPDPLKTPTLARKLAPSLKTVKNLRSTLMSAQVYENPVLFNLFCSGIESGTLRSAPVRPRGRLEDYLTLAHEAHFRLELWYALSCFNYAHSISRDAGEIRVANWKKMLQFVKEDRAKNLAAAVKQRLAGCHESDDDYDDGEDFDADGDDSDSIDPEFWT